MWLQLFDAALIQSSSVAKQFLKQFATCLDQRPDFSIGQHDRYRRPERYSLARRYVALKLPAELPHGPRLLLLLPVLGPRLQ